ncbi:type II secretion system F family protein [Ideonella sp. DXS22W]|uniref:Type II secretion system F family protein n=1 Tax=Pseudaquabacterium inlustre TaxID=2984192 RepID=A0ABU9CES9_9BURK
MAIRFAYTGQGPAGPVSGELEGADAATVAGALQSRGITPLRIAPAAGGAPSSAPGRGPTAAPAEGPWWRRARVGVIDLMLFSRQLHTLLRSGVPILRALAGLQESSVNPAMKHTLAEVRHSLESGIELSKCLAQQAGVFDAFYVAMVRVGEMTGRLDEVFMRLFAHLEFETLMTQQVKSALRYPMFVISAMVVAVGVINVLVIPAFADVFRSFGAQLPLATRILVASSNFTLQWGWLLLAAAVGGGIGLKRWIATPEGRLAWDRWLLNAPLAGPIVRKATLSRFARSFSLALKSGVPIEQALTIVAQTVDNAWIGRKVEGMREAVERGDTILRAAVATGVFTPVVLQMIAVGEETGAVDELMDEIATLYTSDVQYELKTLSQQIEPILIGFLGVMVLVLALGVFLPMWDLGRVSLKK